MSILGAIVRTRPERRAQVAAVLAAIPGVEISHQGEDGRMIVVIEDCAPVSAAQTLASIALLPDALNVSLVYEHVDAADEQTGHSGQYQSWRASLAELARPVASPEAVASPPIFHSEQ